MIIEEKGVILTHNKSNQNQFLLVVLGWFVLSFLVMWFMGGACLGIMDGSSCLAPNTLQSLSGVPLVGLLLPFNMWSSLMYFFAPICGFILAFLVINWWNSYFETKEASGLLFIVLILFALFVGYYINLSFYMGEAANLNSRGQAKYSLYFCITETDSTTCNTTVSRLNQEYIAQAQANNAQTVNQLIPISYWAELRKSMYLLFILGAIAAWIPLFGREVYMKYKESN